MTWVKFSNESQFLTLSCFKLSTDFLFHLWLNFIAAAAPMLLQSCLTLCNPIDGSPPGSSVHRILQARMLESGAISFSNKTSLQFAWISSLHYDFSISVKFSNITTHSSPYFSLCFIRTVLLVVSEIWLNPSRSWRVRKPRSGSSWWLGLKGTQCNKKCSTNRNYPTQEVSLQAAGGQGSFTSWHLTQVGQIVSVWMNELRK